jgi:hypothetical protein
MRLLVQFLSDLFALRNCSDLVVIWGTISRRDRQVCDLLHGGPTAKRLGVFPQCEVTRPALSIT